MFKVLKTITRVVLALLIVAFCVGVCLAFVPFVGMVCYNAVAPTFGWPTINFLQAVCAWIALSLIGGALGGSRAKTQTAK